MKILIIEDEPAIQQTLKDLLEINGHTVIAASDGIEGVKMTSQKPDLILCDVGLPGMDGYEVIKAVRQQPESRDLPFIFLTARADRADQRQGMALGADDYVTKPFTERDLLDAIAARIDRQRPLRERVEELVEQRHRELSRRLVARTDDTIEWGPWWPAIARIRRRQHQSRRNEGIAIHDPGRR